MFLGIIMAFHFITVDAQKAVAIAQEGKIMKNTLQIEGSKSAARNVILLSAYDAIDAALNDRLTDASGDTLEDLGLKEYIKRKIKADLNRVDSTDPNDAAGLGSYEKVEINEKDDQNKLRTDGFIVSAEGDHYGVAMKLEKFVDSGVFGFYSKVAQTDRYYPRPYEKNFVDILETSMECRLGGITCETKYSRDYLSTNPKDFNYRIECTKKRQYKGEGDYEDLDNTQIPGEHFKDASEVVKRIKEALGDILQKELNGYGSLQTYRESDIVLFYNVDKIDAHAEMDSHWVDGDCCVFICTDGKNGNYCQDELHEEDYRVHVNVKGTIHIKELKVVGDATLKETAEGKEVCVKTPIMNKNGAVKAMQADSGEFDIPYTITLSYIEGCKPAPLIQKDAEESFDPLFPGFYINEESIKFSLEPVQCEWGPKDTSYKPECAGMKQVHDECYCKGGCRTEINCPSNDPETRAFCPGHPEKEYCVGCNND
ncbi:MAG: hypothetical protein WAX07_07190 [Candidatus Altiarchaeia archaeon]